MSRDNKDRSRRLLMAWTDKTPEVLDEIVAPEWIDHDVNWPFPDLRGPAAAKAALELYRSTFPDLLVEIEEQFADGDRVITRWFFGGTQTGDLPGVPATGRAFRVPGITIDRHADGRLAESWSAWDAMTMYQQIGAVPPIGELEKDGAR
ncbi:MAG: ester cyclase [Actinophytocola sp.]|uniref:ester cyclase n=1 Tax=Actinophytocola sp. TaxID=1872138 RepID=UPI003C78ED1C